MELPISAGGRLFDTPAGASSRGITLTANGSAHTKGAYTQLIAATTFAGSALLVNLVASHASAPQAGVMCVDIAFGAAGSEQVVIPNLIVSNSASNALYATGSYVYWFPINVPAGVRISARYSAALASNIVSAMVSVYNASTGFVGCQGNVESYGVTVASSTATVIDPGGTVNTKSGWVQLIASTANQIRDLTLAFMCPDIDAAGTDQLVKYFAVDIGIGAAASEKIIVPDILASRGWSQNFSPHVVKLPPMMIPAGTRISARASGSSASSGGGDVRKIAVAAYGCG